MSSNHSFWVAFVSFLSYGLLAALQILWWLDFQRWRKHMTERIRAHGAALREAARAEITRRVGGSRLPPR